MKKSLLTIIAAMVLPMLAMAQGCPTPTSVEASVTFKRHIPGLLDGNFTINASGDKVAFSQGNLQYTKSTGKWKIMDHQYDMVETTGMTIGDDYASQDVVTLFGWGTSGWEGSGSPARVAYLPYFTSTTDSEYGVVSPRDASETLTGANANADWGVFNKKDLGPGWRVLTNAEWGYLMNYSNSDDPTVGRQGNRYAKATVHDVVGLIILPDGWTQAGSAMSATLSGINTSNAAFTTISNDDWTKLESEGAVFLPAAGRRNGTSVLNVGAHGRYWSSSVSSVSYANFLFFHAGEVKQYNSYRSHGISVRLVQDVE